MTNRLRASREVYRVYSEADYFAGAEELGKWNTPPVKGALRERRLSPLRGAAALAGVVGAVGGMIVLVGMGARFSGRHAAGKRTPAPLGASLRAGGLEPAPAVRRGGARRTGGMHRAGSVWRRAAVRRSAVRRPAGSSRSAAPRRMAESTLSAPPGRAPATPAVAYDAAEAGAIERTARSPTQSEFGFER